MSNVLAAIGRGQLLDERVKWKREIFDYYKNALGDLPGIEFMPEASYNRFNRSSIHRLHRLHRLIAAKRRKIRKTRKTRKTRKSNIHVELLVGKWRRICLTGDCVFLRALH